MTDWCGGLSAAASHGRQESTLPRATTSYSHIQLFQEQTLADSNSSFPWAFINTSSWALSSSTYINTSRQPIYNLTMLKSKQPIQPEELLPRGISVCMPSLQSTVRKRSKRTEFALLTSFPEHLHQGWTLSLDWVIIAYCDFTHWGNIKTG